MQEAEVRGRAPGGVRRVLSWFVPASARLQSESYLRAEAFVFIVLMAMVLSALLGLWEVISGNLGSALNLTVLMALGGLTMWLFRSDWRTKGVQHFFLAALVLGMSSDALFRAGLYTGDLIWLSMIPLVGGLLWGVRGVLFWGAVCAGVCLGFVGLHAAGFFEPLSSELLREHNTITAFGLIGLSTCFAGIAQSWFGQAQRHKHEMMTVMARNEALIEQVERLEALQNTSSSPTPLPRLAKAPDALHGFLFGDVSEASRLEALLGESAANIPEDGLLLIIDDEAVVRQSVSRLLGRLGIETRSAACDQHGVALLDEFEGRLCGVLVEMKSPDIRDNVVLRQIRQRRQHLPVVLMGHQTLQSVPPCLCEDAHTRYLSKPFGLTEVRGLLEWLWGEPAQHPHHAQGALP